MGDLFFTDIESKGTDPADLREGKDKEHARFVSKIIDVTATIHPPSLSSSR